MYAQVVELVDTLVLGTSAARRKSSSLFLGTICYNWDDYLII